MGQLKTLVSANRNFFSLLLSTLLLTSALCDHKGVVQKPQRDGHLPRFVNISVIYAIFMAKHPALPSVIDANVGTIDADVDVLDN